VKPGEIHQLGIGISARMMHNDRGRDPPQLFDGHGVRSRLLECGRPETMTWFSTPSQLGRGWRLSVPMAQKDRKLKFTNLLHHRQPERR